MAITYAPRTTNQVGEILGRGIENVGEAFGRSILRSKEQEKEQKEKDRLLKEENDKYDAILKANKYSDGQIASMSIGQKRGVIETLATNMTMERLERERQTWQQEQGDRTRTEGQRRAFENAQLYQRGMTPAGAEPIDMAQAMRNAGVTDPKMFEQGMAMGDAMKGPWKPSVVDAGGGIQAMMTSPNSAQPLRSTAGGAPPAAPRVVGYVPGPDGKASTLAVLQDGKGKWTIANTAGGKLSAVDAYVAYQAVQNANKAAPGWLERMGGKEQTAPAAVPVAPTPAAAAPTLIPSGWEGATNASDFNSDFFNSMEGGE